MVGRASLAESLGWTAEAFDEAFAEVIAEGLAQFDAKTRMWFIPNALKHNFSANPNVVRSWRMQWSLLPECEMRNQVYECLKAALHGLSEAFGNAFEESCGKALGKALPKHSPKQEAGSRKQDRGTREPRGTSLPTDWKPSSEDIGYAEKHGVNVTVESEKFVNYFSTLTGKGSVRKGWSPSWRTWCLKSLEFRQNGHAARPADLDDMFRRGAQ